jgi:hypothetical protein
LTVTQPGAEREQAAEFGFDLLHSFSLLDHPVQVLLDQLAHLSQPRYPGLNLSVGF